MTDLCFSTAEELALGIRLKRWSATEALDAHLTQVRARNGELNALVFIDEEGAHRRAGEADRALALGQIWGPLHGVPVTIKDSLSTAGVRTTAGFPPLANYFPEHDATAVARIRRAGAVIVGKTNLPMLAMDFQCNSPLLGRGNNPWDLQRTPGGSTGGGAAAVASGMSPLEIGSDIGGSVRIPAHYCGICSLKPTEHRVSTAGHIPEPPGAPRGVRHMATVGPLARSVGDLRVALQILAGPDGDLWEAPPAPLEPVVVREPRVAWTDGFGNCPVTADTRRSLAVLANTLAQDGWSVRRASPNLDFEPLWETFGQLLWCEIGSGQPPEVEAESARNLTTNDDDPMMRGIKSAVGASMRQFTAVMTRRDGFIAVLERFLDDYDVLLCPVSVGPAIRHCPPGSAIPVDGGSVSYMMGGLAYTAPFNLTGSPVAVVPMGQSNEGLPLGVQVVGRRWDDMRVLAVAEAIERLLPRLRQP
jgi:amidase